MPRIRKLSFSNMTMILAVAAYVMPSGVRADSTNYGAYWGIAPHCDPKESGFKNFRPPQWGFCFESNSCQITVFAEPLPYCTGSFATLDDIRKDSLAQAILADDKLNQEIIILQRTVKKLSETNDALTKRLNDMQAQMSKK